MSSSDLKAPPPLGVLELIPKGGGFLRKREHSYLPSRHDIHVGKKVIQDYGLRTGDEIAGEVGEEGGRGRSSTLLRPTSVNGRDPQSISQRPDFNELTAIHPAEQLVLDCSLQRLGAPDYTNRVIDLMDFMFK